MEVAKLRFGPDMKRALLSQAGLFFIGLIVLALGVALQGHAAQWGVTRVVGRPLPWTLYGVVGAACFTWLGWLNAKVAVITRSYLVTDHRITVVSGIWPKTMRSIILGRLDDVVVQRDVADMLCGTGTVWLRDPDGGMLLRWIRNPAAVQSAIMELLPGYGGAVQAGGGN